MRSGPTVDRGSPFAAFGRSASLTLLVLLFVVRVCEAQEPCMACPSDNEFCERHSILPPTETFCERRRAAYYDSLDDYDPGDCPPGSFARVWLRLSAPVSSITVYSFGSAGEAQAYRSCNETFSPVEISPLVDCMRKWYLSPSQYLGLMFECQSSAGCNFTFAWTTFCFYPNPVAPMATGLALACISTLMCVTYVILTRGRIDSRLSMLFSCSAALSLGTLVFWSLALHSDVLFDDRTLQRAQIWIERCLLFLSAAVLALFLYPFVKAYHSKRELCVFRIFLTMLIASVCVVIPLWISIATVESFTASVHLLVAFELVMFVSKILLGVAVVAYIALLLRSGARVEQVVSTISLISIVCVTDLIRACVAIYISTKSFAYNSQVLVEQWWIYSVSTSAVRAFESTWSLQLYFWCVLVFPNVLTAITMVGTMTLSLLARRRTVNHVNVPLLEREELPYSDV